MSRPASGPSTVHLSLDAILTDGHGLDLLLRDWWHCYHELDCELPVPEISVRDCVLALEARRGSAGYRRDLDYWAERLSGMPPGPGLASVAAEPDDSGGLPRTAITGSLAPSRWRSLRDRAASLDVSPTSLVLTLFAEALARTEQRDAFSLALTTNSRPWLPREVDDVAGPFTSTTVFVAENTLGEPLDEAAKAVHHRLWQDLGHTAVSGVEVMRELRARDRNTGQETLPVVFTSLLDVGPRRKEPISSPR